VNFELAVRLTEVIMGLAFAQQSLEHIRVAVNGRLLFIARFVLAILLVIGLQSSLIIVLLLFIGFAMLHRFDGPYNGGADRMSLLILSCLACVHLAPDLYWKEIAFAYLAAQLMLSYFISGWVKLINAEWRNGRALCDVFEFSAYPVSESLRGLAASPRVLFVMSWIVILFELLFPLSIMSEATLLVALILAGGFHFANAFLFGLNRFFWIWIAAYPSILWFQQRIFDTISV